MARIIQQIFLLIILVTVFACGRNKTEIHGLVSGGADTNLRLERLDVNRTSVVDSVRIKADGSFYLKIDADIPFRIESLNKQGEVVRGPSDWIYLRPNERRACVGCHADHELAPKNFQPLAIKEDPVVLSAKREEISQ